MIIPYGPEGGSQDLVQIDRAPDGSLKKKSLMGVIYVPLTDSEKQWSSARYLFLCYFCNSLYCSHSTLVTLL